MVPTTGRTPLGSVRFASAAVLLLWASIPACTTKQSILESDEFGSIEGFVEEQGGAVIAGAQVSANGPGSGTDATNETGFYDVRPLKAGSYAVTATASGFTCDGPKSVSVRDDMASRVDFQCVSTTPGGAVTVAVFGMGSPLSGASVELVVAGTQNVARTGLTGVNGQVQFTGVAPGAYTVRATVSGFACGTSSVNVVALGNHSTSVPCSPGG